MKIEAFSEGKLIHINTGEEGENYSPDEALVISERIRAAALHCLNFHARYVSDRIAF